MEQLTREADWLAKPKQGFILSKYGEVTVQYGCDIREVSPISLDSAVSGVTKRQPHLLALGYRRPSGTSVSA